MHSKPWLPLALIKNRFRNDEGALVFESLILLAVSTRATQFGKTGQFAVVVNNIVMCNYQTPQKPN